MIKLPIPPMIPQDKANHFFYGAIIYFAVNLVLGAYIALTIVVLSGILKEVYDKVSKTGTPDVLDAVATIAGGLVCFLS
jgi:hypothetical protein